MRINHNITALNTYRQFNNANNAQSKSMEKLSSGLRINSAADDAAGLAISEKMRSQVRGLDQASKNAQDGISMIQTAEGALNETHDILQRMRELSAQASNDTNTSDDRNEIQKEMNQLTSEVSRIGNTTEFNTQKLLNGNKTGATAPASNATPEALGEMTITVDTSADVTIDGQKLTYAAAATDGTDGNFKDLDSLVGAINNDATLSAKYTASKSGTDLKLVQKTTQGSENVATITDKTGDLTVNFDTGKEGKAAVAAQPAKDGAVALQIGANQGQQFTVTINDMRASALGIAGTAGANAQGVDSDVVGASFTASGSVNDLTDVTNTGEHALDVSTADKASAATKVLDEAIKNVSSERSRLGAYQNRLDHTVNNLSTSSENLTAAESRIRDVDYALAA